MKNNIYINIILHKKIKIKIIIINEKNLILGFSKNLISSKKPSKKNGIEYKYKFEFTFSIEKIEKKITRLLKNKNAPPILGVGCW